MFRQPEIVRSLMRGFAPDWLVAGGWAIDLFIGRQTREHDDIEIAIFRSHQLALQNHLRDWDLRIADKGKLSPWKKGEFLELPIHAIHCFSEQHELSFLEVLLNERSGDVWQFRRDRRITKPLSELYLTNDSGIRFLSPEIVLLYKSKAPRAKDERDFSAVAGRLARDGKNWLKDALSICDPKHPWLKSL